MRKSLSFCFSTVFLACAFTLVHTGSVSAQDVGPRVIQLNKDAMEAFGNLEFSVAKKKLSEAEALCLENNKKDSALARTYINMGVLEYGETANSAGALDFFKKALCIDKNIMLDPLTSTPDLDILFQGAQTQVKDDSSCSGVGDEPVGGVVPMETAPTMPDSEPLPEPEPEPEPATPTPTLSKGEIITHMPLSQQLRMMPLPFFAETEVDANVDKMVLFYRTSGETIFQQVAMRRIPEGWAATVGCETLTTLDPVGVEYYIAAMDAHETLLETSGTEAQPFSVAIVRNLTVQAPVIPGEPAPAKCAEDCPPWNPGCNDTCKQFGDNCEADADCCSGSCSDNLCSEEGASSSGSGKKKHYFRMSANFGTGVGLVPAEDGIHPYSAISNDLVNIKTGFGWSKLHFRLNPMFYLPAERIQIGLTFRGGLVLESAQNKDQEGAPPALSPSLIANMSVQITGLEKSTGFHLYGMFGFGWMNIYNKIPFYDCKHIKPDAETQELNCDTDPDFANDKTLKSHFFRKAGPVGAELGFDAYVWFIENFGLNFGVLLDIAFPDFVFNIDGQMGLAVRF